MGVKLIRLLALIFALGPKAGVIASSVTLPVSDDGVMLKVPGIVFDRSRNLIIDTGCSTTIFDQSFVDWLGAPIGQVIAGSPYQSDLTLNLYRAPAIRLKHLVLPLTSVAAADLQMAQLISGDECSGVLGMDVLSKYIVTFDFAKKQLSLATEAAFIQKSNASPISMIALNEGRYGINAIINGSRCLTLVIDSGSSSSISLNPSDWSSIFGDSCDTIGRVSFFAGVGNNVRRNQTVRLKTLRIGTNVYTNLLCSRLSNPNSISHIGLGLLRRNLVTLDFPHRRLQLVPQTQLPDEQDDMSGLHLLLEQGVVTVYAVELGSPADQAGIRAGDAILSLNGKRSSELKMEDIRHLLQRQEGMEIQAVFNRNGKPFPASFRLKPLI